MSEMCIRDSVIACLIVEALILVLTWSMTDPLIQIFNQEQNAELLHYAHSGLRLYFLGFLFAGINILLVAYFSAVAQPKPAIAGSLLRGAVAIIPCAVTLARLFGLNGVWLSFLASEMKMCIRDRLILAELTHKMKVVTVINHLDIRVFFDKIHIFRRDMRTVQICHVDIFSIFHQPVPDTGQVFLSVEDLDSHLLQRRRIRFLMEVIISDKFNNISLFQEHFQVLERCLGTSVFVKGRHIVIDHDNDLFAHATLACAEWIRIAVVDALVLKPVSYTHLDVYKRQRLYFAGISLRR